MSMAHASTDSLGVAAVRLIPLRRLCGSGEIVGPRCGAVAWVWLHGDRRVTPPPPPQGIVVEKNCV